MQGHCTPPGARRALVLIPGSVNYFYNLAGRRVADALSDLGFDMTLTELHVSVDGEYDCCIFVNLTEVLIAFGDDDAGLRRIDELRPRCGLLASMSLDCVATPWYRRLRELAERAAVARIIDLGLSDQAPYLSPSERTAYHFATSGLTDSEYRELAELDYSDSKRSIPWAFIGHYTPMRAALVDRLIQHVDPSGFLYMPWLAPYTEKGSPHLNQSQYEQVLRHTRYQVWCSHHQHFYLEPERFRTSLLTGGVPVKAIEPGANVPHDVPFRYLVVDEDHLADWMQKADFEALRRRFREDFLSLPRLRDSLATCIQVDSVRARTAVPLALAG